MTPTAAEKRNVLLLVTAQALSQTGGVLVMTLAGLVGLQLAPDKGLATLPIALMMVATAATTIPASLLMQRVGRKAGFLLGTALGVAAGLLAAVAIGVHHFGLFVVATMLMGSYQGFAQFYRFAAADAAASPGFRSRAISWVIAGGVVAAVAGPNLARFTQAIGPAPFVASYLALAVLGGLAALAVARLALPAPSPEETHGAARPLPEILRAPVFLTALIGSTAGFAVMSMVMTATPVAMHMHGHAVGAAATVIQWHVLGMFVPSFFTGALIRRFGVLAVMAAGTLLLGGHVAVALSGHAFLHFVSGLILLGVGWNFLFVGGTTLLTEAYRPAEKGQVQAAHDFLVIGAAALTSFSAGKLLDAWGWQAVNLTALPLLAVALAAVLGLALARRRQEAVLPSA
ncbi:MAG: major facilitator superfamily 1 [Burkholderiales bacterium]|jgi:MFS family permease|nr:major facilitator superfamily 1 [Burkholderiales bacterium]